LTLTAQKQKGSAVLDIGSHYLHSSLLLSFLGYEVYSMDVKEFWDVGFVSSRQTEYDLKKIVEDDLETFTSHENIADRYDVILFTEILEHITYNPVHFWRRMYDIVKPDGLIYISTPNSLSLYSITRTIARIITFRGIGLPVNEVFKNVTYGHHWKEYSSSEIRKYFSKMSDDFEVITKKYHYRRIKMVDITSTLIAVLSFIGNKTSFLADEIEVVVHVKKAGSWKVKSPEY
jgi:2-polyprenyl-6-hydroxyphenyl methylase/3-demethylubiquinone-9 3-methyltransferase